MSWGTELTALATRIAGPLFTRPEPRHAFADLVRALLADVPRKNSWPGSWPTASATPPPTASSTCWTVKWDADALRDEVRST